MILSAKLTIFYVFSNKTIKKNHHKLLFQSYTINNLGNIRLNSKIFATFVPKSTYL